MSVEQEQNFLIPNVSFASVFCRAIGADISSKTRPIGPIHLQTTSADMDTDAFGIQ